MLNEAQSRTKEIVLAKVKAMLLGERIQNCWNLKRLFMLAANLPGEILRDGVCPACNQHHDRPVTKDDLFRQWSAIDKEENRLVEQNAKIVVDIKMKEKQMEEGR